MAVTLADVAARAGVCRQTVSNVISNPQLVKSSTREKVQEAIRELRYTPNVRARLLRQQRTGTVGLRIQPPSDNVSSVLLDRFLHELSARAANYDKHVLLFTATSDAQEVNEISSLTAQSLVDEFVLTDTHPEDERIGALNRLGHRFVAFGRPWGAESTSTHSWVDVDGKAGTAEATRALLSAGCRRIGFLGWPTGSATGDDRRAGWAETMRAVTGATPAGLDGLAAESVDDVTAAMAAAPILFDAGVDAVVCASDTLATGVVAALRARNTSFPIIGFDNTPFAASLGFSSVDQDLGNVAEAVLNALSNLDQNTTSIITPRLHVRHDPRWGLSPALPKA